MGLLQQHQYELFRSSVVNVGGGTPRREVAAAVGTGEAPNLADPQLLGADPQLLGRPPSLRQIPNYQADPQLPGRPPTARHNKAINLLFQHRMPLNQSV